MNFIIIGPGEMTIPPRSWGGVENVCADYRNNLQELGHKVSIINTKDLNVVVALTNMMVQSAPNSTFVHIHYDDYAQVAEHLNCQNIAVTSHYGYLEQPDKWSEGYKDIFWSFVNSKAHIFCLSEGMRGMYAKAGVPAERLHVIPNSIRTEKYRFETECKFPDRSLYLAKIDFRKRQHIFQDIESLYFAGGCFDERFNQENPRWLGEWRREKLYNELTYYGNLVLLSDGEAHPAVCQEAFSAGLGVVISEYSTANLDLDLPFIDVIPENKVEDLEYVTSIIDKNREYSVNNREEIRKYAIDRHGWKEVVSETYLPKVFEIAGHFKPFIWSHNV
tara:strand:- start:777 stop:1775 length:999 start_codon:yes stop_codon:yes gene_type:complete